MNDASFRRQTKSDSTKTPQEVELESPYMSAILASFRGVSTILQMAHHIPIPLAIKAMNHIARQVASGDTMGTIVRGLGDIKVPEGTRFKRPGEEKEKKPAGKTSPPPADEGEPEPLFPLHSLAAFQLTGLFGMAKK